MLQCTLVRKSRFHKFLIKLNNLDTSGFKEWVFYPGMVFNNQYKWWGNGGIRQRPHEGLDFCFYRDVAGQDHSLDEKTKIPVMYTGEIVSIHDDFLGKSLFVRHAIFDDYENRLHTIYGHTNPYPGVDIGRIFREGEVIAAIADTGKKDTQIPPHLHISVAWLPKSFPYNRLNWETMGDRGVTTLCNPLEFIDGDYTVEQDRIAL
ncbi:conserved hypothetical protein [Candidatus Brocadia pituitae]|nr:conserved hypothetical protein [Candidatus Brocadia pituitae]